MKTLMKIVVVTFLFVLVFLTGHLVWKRIMVPHQEAKDKEEKMVAKVPQWSEWKEISVGQQWETIEVPAGGGHLDWHIKNAQGTIVRTRIIGACWYTLKSGEKAKETVYRDGDTEAVLDGNVDYRKFKNEKDGTVTIQYRTIRTP